MTTCPLPYTNVLGLPRTPRLFVGGNKGIINGEVEDLGGDRMFSAAWRPRTLTRAAAISVCGMLDSGAFTDPPHQRLSPDQALLRQLAWEERAANLWGVPFQAAGLVSYDRLIDETWVAGTKHKRRWSVAEAERAVGETVAAAAYLAGQREHLHPRRLILAAQGVDALQYTECAQAVLQLAQPGDLFGLGGWCILGAYRSWLEQFYATLQRVLPLVRAAGLDHVHLFGVLYPPALGALVAASDPLGISVSVDSGAPITQVTRYGTTAKSCALAPAWRENVALHRERVRAIRQSVYYRIRSARAAARQETFL